MDPLGVWGSVGDNRNPALCCALHNAHWLPYLPMIKTRTIEARNPYPGRLL